jgi:hypothetical protein
MEVEVVIHWLYGAPYSGCWSRYSKKPAPIAGSNALSPVAMA